MNWRCKIGWHRWDISWGVDDEEIWAIGIPRHCSRDGCRATTITFDW